MIRSVVWSVCGCVRMERMKGRYRLVTKQAAAGRWILHTRVGGWRFYTDANLTICTLIIAILFLSHESLAN